MRTDGLATAALVVGILSVVASVTCLGLVAGPAAAYMGTKAAARIASSNGKLQGKRLARAGQILGVIGFFVGVAFFIAAASAIRTMRSLI